MPTPVRPTLLRLFLCTLLAVPGAAVAQIEPDAERQPPVRVDLVIGLAILDPIHTINAAPLFLTPGVQVRSTGPVFAFADARLLVFALPFISGSGAEHVEDDEGRFGFRDTGGMGGGGWVRAGLGVSLEDLPLAPTLTVAGGSVGVRSGAHPWFGASAGVHLRGRWRLEVEVGYDRNWVEDTFLEDDPASGPNNRIAYVHRTENWYPTRQIGLRYVR